MYLSIPLTETWTASIGQNDSAELPHDLGQPVALDGCADLLRAGGNVESAPCLQTNKRVFSFKFGR